MNIVNNQDGVLVTYPSDVFPIRIDAPGIKLDFVNSEHSGKPLVRVNDKSHGWLNAEECRRAARAFLKAADSLDERSSIL